MKRVRVLKYVAALIVALSAVLVAGSNASADSGSTSQTPPTLMQPADIIWGG